MPRNGSGDYTLPSGSWNPAVDGQSATPDDWNALAADLSDAISGSIAADGQTPITANIPMSGFKLTGLAAGSATGQSVRYDQIGVNASVAEGRLTLTPGVPVTTSDVTAATTVYYTPYVGARLAVYDGSSTWTILNFAETSIAVPSTTTTNYDVFGYSDSGVLALELTAWSTQSTRATALVLQNGVYVKSGATTRRYLGSFCTTPVSGQTEDSLGNRLVWNMYNRQKRPLRTLETADSWTYSSAAYRVMNNNNNNIASFVRGLNVDGVTGTVFMQAQSSTATLRTVRCAINDGLSFNIQNAAAVSNTAFQTLTCSYSGFPPLGYGQLSPLEYGAGTDTQTWYGDNGGTIFQMGLVGETFG